MTAAVAGARLLRAQAAVSLPNAAEVMNALCSHFTEHADVIRQDNEASLVLPYGQGFMKLQGEELDFRVESDDETSLAYMKMAVAEHLVEFAGRSAAIAWIGDGTQSRVPPFFREMRVAGCRQITPRVRRITLRGDDLARFAVNGLHVRLLLPPPGRPERRWPEVGADGRMRMPEGADALVARVYTIRRIDPRAGEIDLDMVLHPGENMPGAEFAAKARPGDVVGLTGPGGGAVPAADRLLLFGDETALPAIARILSEIAPGVRARAVVEIEDEAECQDLAMASGASLEWLIREGRPEGSLLTKAVRDTVGPQDAAAFVWIAGEFSVFREARKYLRSDLKRSREDHLVVSYWRRGVNGDGRRAKRG